MNIFRMAPLLFLQLIITASLADEVQVVASFGEAVPHEASDLDEIRLHVVGSNPELASSPGIKFGHAVQGRNGSVEGGVIFHPHSDAGGVKEALQVSCSRSAVGQPWVCEQAMIRRYFRTGGQDFEFRVVDGILGSKESIAVVEASGNSLRYIIGSGPQAPCEALSIMEGHAGG